MIAGGERLGGCGRGRKDCRRLLYVPAALDSSLLRAPSVIGKGIIPDASLIPRLWPAPVDLRPLDDEDERVLVRLGGKGFELVE